MKKKNLYATSIKAWRDQARKNVCPGPAPSPPITDYRKAENTYQARFSEDWEAEIWKSSALSPYVCVSTYIDHIVANSAEVFCGTEHEDEWVLYHDSLGS
mmetsp:Transcript_62020/g.183193  ORF Transcript_62020/g.183193 Transcript_62020/m.183193 type:complete len:100 (-) Transcript_62020:327-626(-)